MQNPQSEELHKQNAELQRQFGVEGFPTILILNSEGKLIGKMVHIPGEPQSFIQAVKSIIAKNNASSTGRVYDAPLSLLLNSITDGR